MSASVLAPLSGDFGLASATELALIGGACGAVGVWVLHFGRAILAESFSHALLPGLVLAAMVGAGLFFGALVGVACAYVLLLASARAPRTSGPTANSVTVTTLVAVGALLASSGAGAVQFESLLFGDPLASSWSDVATAGVFAALTVAALALLGARFAALAFDPGAAPALGVNTARVSAAALALLAISVSVAANVSGTLLALALVTGPALGASAIAHRLRPALVLSALVGALSGVAGIYLSYYADWPASASIALVICLWAVLAGAFSRIAPVRARVA